VEGCCEHGNELSGWLVCWLVVNIISIAAQYSVYRTSLSISVF
jgi:hypothetical protein